MVNYADLEEVIRSSGHASTDLDYASTSALALNGGTIKDAGREYRRIHSKCIWFFTK